MKTTQQTHSRFSHWLLSHCRAFLFAISELVRTPVTNIITICVVSIAIALPLGFYVLLKNLEVVNTSWNTSAPTISLYLKLNTPQTVIDSAIRSLQSDNQIEKVTYISPNAGLKLFEKNTSFKNVSELFEQNPIPGVITILPAQSDQNPTDIHKLYHSLKSLSFVDTAQLDMNWVTRLFDVIAIGDKIANALSLLFGVGVILIIGHTLRSSLSSHLDEIQVMRLIGATNSYIRRPLLYRGIGYGILGAGVAWVLINGFLYRLQSPVSKLANTYHTVFQLQKITFPLGITVLFICGFAGLISAWLITTQFLNQQEILE